MRVFDQGLRPAGRLRPAAAGARAATRRPAPVPHGALGLPARPPVPGAGRFAPRPAAAAGRPAGDHVPRLSRRAARRSLRRPGKLPPGADLGSPQGHALDDAHPPLRTRARRRSWCARRWPIEPRDGHLCVFLPPLADGEDYAALIAAIEATAASDRAARSPRRLRAALRSAPQRHQGHARSRRDRGQRAPGHVVATTAVDITTTVYDEARASRPRRREVHARRPPRRHRRRQPHRARRHHAGRQPLPAAPRSAGQHHRLLAEPPLALLPVLRPVRRADQPGAARRRGAARSALRAGDRAARRSPSPAAAIAALAGRPPVPQPAGRRHRQYASGRDLHRQAVRAGRARWAASASSSSAPSRCRRTRA